jgi:hypothetical protein
MPTSTGAVCYWSAKLPRANLILLKAITKWSIHEIRGAVQRTKRSQPHRAPLGFIVKSSDAHRQRVHSHQYKGCDEQAAGSSGDSGFHSPVHAVVAAGRRGACCISFRGHWLHLFSLARANIPAFRVVPMSPAIVLVCFGIVCIAVPSGCARCN